MTWQGGEEEEDDDEEEEEEELSLHYCPKYGFTCYSLCNIYLGLLGLQTWDKLLQCAKAN